MFNDENLEIDWKVPLASIQLSDKDKVLPTIKEVKL
jgi:dTDP-4-dehydrorhamnose 3,5-epimerase-like enzyme